MENRTKIICTIGPSSEKTPVLRKMMRAGMDCARLNFSHGNYREFAEIIGNIRRLSKETGREIAIIQDLQGPKIRVGDLPAQGIIVEKGETIILSVVRAKNTIPVQYKQLARDVHAGDKILINDGLIELKTLKINKAKTQITCAVVVGGLITSHKGINVPTASIAANPITAKDKRDLDFGVKHEVDYVALSFVKSAENIFELRRLLKRKRSRAKIIAKIERHEAVKNMEEIIVAADATMVARGDLGVEMPAEQVPLIQKKIIHLCNTHGKPVIVATQMLDSMIENPRPTRAEISDAATAIFDHADAFMLSNETATGKYPVEAARTLMEVASAVERDLRLHPHLLHLRKPEDMGLANATCLNACKLAQDIRAKFIVAVTKTGYTAREIAKYRPFTPIIVFTPDVRVQRELALVWAVTRSFAQRVDLKNPLPGIRETLLARGLVKKGDEIVVCNAGFGKKEKLITTTVV